VEVSETEWLFVGREVMGTTSRRQVIISAIRWRAPSANFHRPSGTARIAHCTTLNHSRFSRRNTSMRAVTAIQQAYD
jgi:hypothetical protein